MELDFPHLADPRIIRRVTTKYRYLFDIVAESLTLKRDEFEFSDNT